jgi:hypothetical protein
VRFYGAPGAGRRIPGIGIRKSDDNRAERGVAKVKGRNIGKSITVHRKLKIYRNLVNPVKSCPFLNEQDGLRPPRGTPINGRL